MQACFRLARQIWRISGVQRCARQPASSFISSRRYKPFEGVLFAAVFHRLRDKFFGCKYGWFLLTWTLVGLCVLGTFGAPGGLFEGFIFTTSPIVVQIGNYIEVGTQTFLLSALPC